MTKKDLARKITSWMTLGIFAIHPSLTFAAEILPDTSAPIEHQPQVLETANGLPLVQITTPSAGGVSMNLYNFFNVPERGAILNNSYSLSATKLAGYVQGNPNLMNGAAKLIVNEVTSTNPSNLRGFLEIAGEKAGVVIANPNGILADGAGFLNTARVTLATGRTEMDAAGNLKALRVEGGKIRVTGNGLNAKGVDTAELYARAIEINAGLWAEYAKIVTGANTIGYTDGKISPIRANSKVPSYALDLSAIGGMYTNRIVLVGTEKGLGVNLAGQITSTQAAALDVNGNLKTSGTLYTDKTTSIHADRIENSGTVYGGQDVTISTRVLHNDGKIISSRNAAFHADRILGSGTFGSGISPSGKANANGTLTMDAKEIIHQNANILSGNGISITADRIRAENSTIAGNGDIAVTSKHALAIEKSTVQSGKNLSIRAGSMALTGGNVRSKKDMALTIGRSPNNTVAADFFGNIHADGNLTAKIQGTVSNKGTITSNHALHLTATGNFVQGKDGITAGKHLSLQAANLTNQGLVQADELLEIKTAQFKNTATGRIYGNDITLSAAELKSDGKIISSRNAAFHADRILGSGTFGSGISPSGKLNTIGSLTMDAKEIIQTNANILSGNGISITADRIRAENSIIAGNGDISVAAKGHLGIDKTTVQSGKNLSIRAGSMPLMGNLSSGKDMTLTVGGSLDNTSAAEAFGNLLAGGSLTANIKGDVHNQKKIKSNGSLRLTVHGNLSQTKTGEITGDNLNLITANLVNQGLLQADVRADITAAHLKNNATGRIYASELFLHAKSIVNEKDAALEARLAAELAVLREKAALLEDVYRTDVTKFTSEEEISAYKGIRDAEAAYDAQQRIVDTVKAALDTHPSGSIAARAQLSLTADTIQNTASALLYAGKDMALSAANGLLNRGARIEAQGNITITAPMTKNENAAFSAKRVITETKENPVKILIQEDGHDECGKVFPETEFSDLGGRYGAHHLIPRGAYITLKQLSPEEINKGGVPIPDELIGTQAPNYAYDDPIFQRFGVPSMSTPRPAHGDPAQAAWDAQYKTILAELNKKIDALEEQAIHHHTIIRSTATISRETVTSSLPGSIRAGRNILLNGNVENEDSNIVAGGTLQALGTVRADAQKQQELVFTTGTTQFTYTKKKGGLHKGRRRVYDKEVFMTPEMTESNTSPIGIQTYEAGRAVSVATENITDAQRAQVQDALSPFGLVPSRETINGVQPQQIPNTLAPSRETINGVQPQQIPNTLAPSRETINDVQPQQIPNTLAPSRETINGARPQQIPNTLAPSRETINGARPQQIPNTLAPSKETINGVQPQQIPNTLTPSKETINHARPQQIPNTLAPSKETVNGARPQQIPNTLAPSRETINGAQPQQIPNILAPSKETINGARPQQIPNTPAPSRESKKTEDKQIERLFVSSLYRVSPAPTAHYLIETDPAFTNQRKFLSSDYMYQQMKWNPDRVPKRIGDGFYEQQLLADQILKQTGKRHLEGYTDDEAAFRALMDAGIAYAKKMNLTPGISLSKEQMAALTSDMIWLEERDVYVNGRKERAVYPVLYTKNTNGLRLTAGGSLISAKNLVIETKDTLRNAATLYGENILAHAGAIEFGSNPTPTSKQWAAFSGKRPSFFQQRTTSRQTASQRNLPIRMSCIRRQALRSRETMAFFSCRPETASTLRALLFRHLAKMAVCSFPQEKIFLSVP